MPRSFLNEVSVLAMVQESFSERKESELYYRHYIIEVVLLLVWLVCRLRLDWLNQAFTRAILILLSFGYILFVKLRDICISFCLLLYYLEICCFIIIWKCGSAAASSFSLLLSELNLSASSTQALHHLTHLARSSNHVQLPWTCNVFKWPGSFGWFGSIFKSAPLLV